MNLDFAKVCGRHSPIYEAYYKQIDPKGSGAIEAMTAAKFLKKSGLSDVVLSRVWDLSDPNGKGFLDKPGFFVALKLVSLAQAGQVINMSNIYMDTANPPKVGDLPKIMPPRMPPAPVISGGVGSANASTDWSIKIIDRLKYEQLFETLKPVGGMLPGNKVKGVLMDSKLPMEILGKIWDLADQDKDGNLDKHEFIVAMHLVYQTLEKRTIPDILPPELRKAGGAGPPPPKPAPPIVAAVPSMPRAPSGEGFGDGGFVANFPKDIAPPPAIPPLPLAMPSMATRVPPVGGVSAQPLISTDPLIPIGAPQSVTANADWVVTPAEMKRFEVIFRDSDRDKDGLVSGLEVKNVFLQSGVPQNCLAHIWAICDTNQSGKLALEQFALAMWMVERKQKGIEPPQVMTANMVPPSMRSTVSGVDLQQQAEPKSTYSNPELEMISKEIEELAKERRALETEIAQKEADIRIKSGEVRSLQSELDTLSATLKQLENQRGEAQKRLDDLKAQVNKIREQCQKQEETINEQEGELNAKRSELQKLKDEEAALQTEYDENNRELQKLTQHLQNTQLQISSVRSMVTQLMETQRQMTDALLMCRAAIESQDSELVSEYQLKIEPDLDDARKTLDRKIDEPKADPFENNTSNAAKTSNGYVTNGFARDPFAAANSSVVVTTTINTARGGFDDSFNTTNAFDSGFDAFTAPSTFGQQKDPFGGDAFGASKPNAVTPEPGKDDFGSDPFAALHAPTGQGQVLSPNAQKSGPPPRPESPSPALPPKKSKVPPPRPAPPRPLQQAPARPSQPAMDAFGAPASSGGGAFADFADFDNKLPTIPPPLSNITRLSSSSSMSHPLSSSNSLFDDTIASSSSTTSASISTTSNQNLLTRSITPLQQAASAFIATSIATTNSGSASITNHKNDDNSKAISGPTDFSDDPFKDYRYEDPFNIKDPFADDGDEEAVKVFNDNLSSDDDDKFKDTKNSTLDSSKTSTSTKTSQTFNSAKSNTPIGNDFLEQFDAFNMNPSPVPSQQSSTASGAFGGYGGGGENTSSSNKSQSNTPIPIVPAAAGSLFDNFADFDAFSTKSSSTADSFNAPTNNNNNNNNSTNTITSNKTNNTHSSFFDAFNDNFDINSSATEVKKSNTDIFDAFDVTKPQLDAFGSSTSGNLLASGSAFDAFTADISTINAVTKSSKLFDDFSDNSFGDDFFKTETAKDNNFNFSNNKSNNNTATSMFDNHSKMDNFAKFDDFGSGGGGVGISDFADDFSTALNNSKNLSSSSESAAAATATSTLTKLAKVQNHTTLTKTPNKEAAFASGGGENGAKLPEKFKADYSKPETFDDDLQEALKRSMMDN